MATLKHFKLINILIVAGGRHVATSWSRNEQTVNMLDEILQRFQVFPKEPYAVITNYENEEIPQTSTPFVVRNLRYYSQFLGNLSGESLRSLPFPVNYNADMHCIVPRHHDKMAAFSKMWDKPLQIELFPQEYKLDRWKRYCFERVESMDSALRPYLYKLPFPTVSVNIIISREKTRYSHGTLERWMNPQPDYKMYREMYHGNQLKQDIFLKMDIPDDIKAIKEIIWLKPCGYCYTNGLADYSNEKLQLGKLSISEFRDSNFWKKISDKYTSDRWMGSWTNRYWGRPRPNDGISRFMNSCPNETKLFAGLNLLQDNNRYDAVVSEILLSIMTNKTYRLSYEYYCDNGVLKRVNPKSSDRWEDHALAPHIEWRKIVKFDVHMRHQLSIEDTQSGLRFVTCGIRGIQSFRFAELYKIYDTLVWVAILGSVCGLSAVSVGYGSNVLKVKTVPTYILKFLGHNLRFMKVLLEQRDPFPATMTSNLVIRWLLTGFFLAAIILSKAYKGTNVYNVIRPRPALLYETLNHLIRHRFSIYSRISNVHIDIPFGQLGKLSMHVFRHEGILAAQGMHFGHLVLATTEVSDMMRIHLEGGYKAESRKMNKLHSYSHLHPRVPRLLKKLGRSIVEYTKDERVNRDDVAELVRKRFMAKESGLYWRELQFCNKTAVVLPESQSRQYARKLKRYGMSAVSVGSEVYGQESLGIDVRNYAPFSTIDRISRLMESGISEWLPRLARPNDGSGDKEIPWPTSVSIKGNVAVIFIVLLAGAGIGLVCFLLEKVGRWGRLKMFSRKFPKSWIIRVESAATRDENMANLDEPDKLQGILNFTPFRIKYGYIAEGKAILSKLLRCRP